MTPHELRERLELLRDLGIRELILTPRTSAIAGPPPAEVPVPRSHPEPPLAVASVTRPPVTEIPATALAAAAEAPPLPAIEIAGPSPKSTLAMDPLFPLPPLAPADDSLAAIRADIGDCRRCRLCHERTNIVFGSGNEASPLVFVGEGPGADEDQQGLPFVGRAGQLLTQMIDNTAEREGFAIRRPDVYICNVVKCRPPENRTPQPDEMETCGQFLFRQLTAIRPKAICCLGGTAAKALLGLKEGITKARGQWYRWRDIPVMVTYHPSYLLRNQSKELRREAWEDLKKVLHLVYD